MSLQLRIAFFIATGLLGISCSRGPDVTSAAVIDRLPKIDPDYASLVIPPNIAPLNFRIEEEARDYFVKIASDAAPPLNLHCPDGTCQVGPEDWREILRANKGMNIYYDVHAKKDDGTWMRFQRITNAVARDSIDSHIVFRQLFPNKKFSTVRGIFQRNLETFDRSALVTLRDRTFKCFNCHTFHQHNPNRFLLHIRGPHAGMMLFMDGKTRKVETKQDPMFRPLAYASWHPDGIHIAATLNVFKGFFSTTAEDYYFQAIEKRGDLVVYNVETNAISTTQEVFENRYIETHPCWSNDGKQIYFVRCEDKPLLSHEDFDAFKFDLMRISYDAATDSWGSPEMVVAYSQAARSCAFPRPSPCGRYVLHILADRATYPIHQKSSDVYLLDLESKEYRRLDVASSDLAESYPRWSSNGRWFSFLSNRRDGMSALPYFAYFDTEGRVHKAFVLPQEDPAFYDTFTDTYNVLELVKSRVEVNPFDLARAMQQPAADAVFPNPPEVDAYTGATWIQLATEATDHL
jgi:hypothetical protein